MAGFELNLNVWWGERFCIDIVEIHSALDWGGAIGLGCFFYSHQRQSFNNSF